MFLVKWEFNKNVRFEWCYFKIIDVKLLGLFFRIFFRKFSFLFVMEIIDEDEDVRVERLRVENGGDEFDFV